MPMPTPSQSSTLSPEATAFLNSVPSSSLLSFFPRLLTPYLATPKQAKTLRAATVARLTPIEEDLISRHGLTVHPPQTIASVPCLIIDPPPVKKDSSQFAGKILLNFFGGGFVMGGPRERAALLMAAEIGIRVISVGYSLSPEVRYPVARDEALTVYRALVTGSADGGGAHADDNGGIDLGDIGAEKIIGMGSSAGAQILVSMLLAARAEGLAMPRAVYLCTPALDLSGAGDSMVSNGEGRDIMPAPLLGALIRTNYMPESWSGDSSSMTCDPGYSPIYAEYDEGFPPTIITVGTRDMCLSDGVRMYWKLREAGVKKVELLIFEGMWHGFNWNETIPEAIKARRAVQDFLAGAGS